jgi:4a-hydroxytetrahydrobiopterin dehydratase
VSEPDLDAPLSRTAASTAVVGIGWRYLLGVLAVSVPVQSLARASEVAAVAVAACGQHADGHLRVDMRADRVELSVQTRALGVITGRDAQLAHRIDSAVAGLGLAPAAATSAASPRPVQMLEVAIDALDIPAIRPFWKAVMGYADRIHLDITVAHDEAEPRVRAALGAGGRLVDDSFARSFWVLADAEGNEVCVCTWTDRDEREQ